LHSYSPSENTLMHVLFSEAIVEQHNIKLSK
jgi:hypothetical protein